MKFTLTDFEQSIDPVILKRGLQYYKKGYVTAFDEVSYNEYEAIVEGTEIYTVGLTINDGIVMGLSCDCPYDLGPVCKHEVAAMYYAARDFFAEQNKEVPVRKKRKADGQKNKSAPSVKSKPKTISEQLTETLEAASVDDLKLFISRLCERDRQFRTLFLAQFAVLYAPATKELYSGQIRALTKSVAGRDHHISYYQARQLGRMVDDFVQNARQALSGGNVRMATSIACAVIDEMVRALDMADDSDGAIVTCANAAVDILTQVVENSLDEVLRKELFEYFVSTYEDRYFTAFDWQWNMMSLAIAIVGLQEEKEMLKDMLGKAKYSEDEWSASMSQKLLFELLQKTEGEASAMQFMEENVDLPNFREHLIKLAINSHDYERAISLANAGILKDEKDKPGLAVSWRKYLLEVFLKQKDYKNAVVLLRYFLTSQWGARQDAEVYYSELKQLTPLEQWNATVEGMVKDLSNKGLSFNYERISAIRIWEQQWDKLLELLRQNVTLARITSVEPYLKSHYTVELVSLYRQCIMDSMKLDYNVNRNHYKEVCRCLRRIIKLGARADAESIASELLNMYPARRALKEELNNL